MGILGPVTAREGTGRKYNEAVASSVPSIRCLGLIQVGEEQMDAKGLIQGGQMKITKRNSSRTSSCKYQEPRLQNIRAQSEEGRVLGCKIGEPS